jgi:hypothetical protein
MMYLLTPIITIPTEATADIFGIAGQLFTDLWPLLKILVAVGIAMLILSFVVSLLRPNR